LKQPERVAIKSYEANQLDFGFGKTEGSDGDDGGLCLRKSEGASRDRREGYRLCAELIGDLDRAPIARRKRVLLPSRSAKPNGSDGVDDPATREIKTRGRFRIAHIAAAK